MARPLAGFFVSRIDMAGFTYDVQYDDAILDDTFISQRKGVARFLLINHSVSSCDSGTWSETRSKSIFVFSPTPQDHTNVINRPLYPDI